MTETDSIPAEFPRPFNADRLQDAPRQERIVANESERAALAARFGILSIEMFEADLVMSRPADNHRLIDVRGTLKAKVTQACIVTMEPVPEEVTDSFDTIFADEAYVQRWLRDNPHDEYEAPEPLEGSWLDMGELAAQYLSLALNPYPRKAGLPLLEEEQAAEDKPNPFAVLAKLKK